MEHRTALGICRVKYLNNVVEQDHRIVKCLVHAMPGSKFFEQRTWGFSC